jgi:RNA polymerase sigma factor (sigma-70 family)
MTPLPQATTQIEILAAQRGDRAALEEVVRRYLPRVRAAVALQLGCVPRQIADVDDITQDAMARAIETIDRYEQRSEGTFLSWLTRIAENRVRDSKRRQQRQKRGGGQVKPFADVFSSTVEEPPVAGREVSPTAFVRGRELADAEMRALLQMPPAYRKVIADRDILHLTFEEIAHELGYRTPNPVRALYHRAKKLLRRMLREFEPGATPEAPAQ